MNLSDYVTRTEINHRVNKNVQTAWTIGIDYGFSGVKGFAPNKVFCFPNCAVQVDTFESLVNASDHDILLKDKDGLWIVGEKAFDIMSPENAMNYESEMYERNRYFSPSFKALMKVGLGIGLSGNHFRKYKGEPILVQTGLPPKYKEFNDASLITEALAGDYEFELRIGKSPFQRFRFTIKSSNIFVMDQPKGALFSAITMNNGSFCPDGEDILKSNTLVVDPGFKTLDLFDISAGIVKGTGNTFDTLGMYEVFRRTVDDTNNTYGTRLTVSGMQKALKKGYVSSFRRSQGRIQSTKLTSEFEALLDKNTREVCDEAVQKLFSIYDYLQEHDNLIITGGTGDAWKAAIEDQFKDMDSLRILSADRNDPNLTNIYSNVRGYYYFLVGKVSYLDRR